ncbi:MAG: hypothetical protein GXP29_08270, partial [Planctomycetes bacterium]|nr:hypothetical protein [Planctomycetota bacterium]
GTDVYLALPLPRGDFDGDGDVDDADAESMIGCLSGPDNDYALGCGSADLNVDSDVDLGDYAAFQEALGAP